MSSRTYQLSCDCGNATLTAHGVPEVSLYCHCGSCRALYGTVMLAGTAWRDDNVELPEADRVIDYRMSDRDMRRFVCRECGVTLYGRHRPGMPVISHSLFRKANGGELPAELAPTLHLFYRDRVLDVADDLPKSEGGELMGM